jgi:hypothetical protein
MKGEWIGRTVRTHIFAAGMLDSSCRGRTNALRAHVVEMSKSVLIRNSDDLPMTARFDTGKKR